MYLIFLDTETTGLNPEKHRILEIAYKVLDTATDRVLIGYEEVIAQPAEVWAAADPQSLKVNGFDWETILGGKSEKFIASQITQDFNHLELSKRGGVFVCQNPSFDRAFFTQLINVDLQEHYGWPYHWLDLASMYWATCVREDQKKASLMKEKELSKNAIARHFGLPEEERPHRAMNGVRHLMACYQALFSEPAKRV